MADKCLCHAYFEGVYDKQIKQGQDFDLAQGVRAIDGYGNEVDFTYEPTEIDLCKTGDQEVTYKAFGASFNIVPKLCMPKYKRGVSIPEACSSDLEMITAKRIIRIIRASNPRFLGITRVSINENVAFDPTEGVTAVDDNGNEIDFSYEGKYDLVAEGDGITTFETEYEQNAKAVKVALEPIQDLHGYDKPWAGGAGRNLLNVGSRVNQTTAGVAYTSDENYIVLNGIKNGQGYADMSTLTIALEAGTYYFRAFVISGTQTSTDWSIYPFDGSTNLTSNITFEERSLTLTEAMTIRFRFGIWNEGTTFTNLKIGIVVSKTSGITAWTPYSNICPISGRTEVVTQVSQRNLFDGEANEMIPIHLAQSTKVVASAKSAVVINYYNASGERIDYWTLSQQSGNRYYRAFTIKSECYYFKFDGGTDLQIEIGTSPTEYETPTTYTTDLGQTVYGGVLDVVSGELVVDRMVRLLDGSENWSYNATTNNILNVTTPAASAPYFESNADEKVRIVADKMKGVASATATSSSTRASGNIAIISDRRIYASISTDIAKNATEFTNWVSNNPITVVYELASPQTIQLTPQQVELLKGTNNVWSDEGDVMVIYEGNIPQDGSFEYPLEGEYTITYKATDKCGNEGTAERTIVVTPSE